MNHYRLNRFQQQPAARIFCKVTAPCFFVVKTHFADDPQPLCLGAVFTFGPSAITVPVWVLRLSYGLQSDPTERTGILTLGRFEENAEFAGFQAGFFLTRIRHRVFHDR